MGSPRTPQTSPEPPTSEAESPGGVPHTHTPLQPAARAPGALPPRRSGEGTEGRREPSASLHRPRWREGGSGEGATQTVALGKLRPQFFQVCLSERRGVGAPLGDLPSRRGRPGGCRAPRPAREEGRMGRRALPRVHTMRQPRRTPSPAGEAAGASAAQHRSAAAGRAPTEK